MDLEIIEIDRFNKAVLSKAGAVMKLEVSDIGIKPDRLSEIKFMADLLDGLKDHSGAGHRIVGVFSNHIFYQMIILPYFSPHTKQTVLPPVKAFGRCVL